MGKSGVVRACMTMDYPYEYLNSMDKYINWDAARDVRSLTSETVVTTFPSIFQSLAIENDYHTMIVTGGEPLTRPIKGVMRFCRAAKRFFSRVILETAIQKEIMEHKRMNTIPVDAIWYHYHSKEKSIPNVKHLDAPVYCYVATNILQDAMLTFVDMPQTLYNRGYAGMVIYRRYPDGEPLRKLLLQYANFKVFLKQPEDEFKYSVLTVERKLIWEQDVKIKEDK